VTMRQQDKGKEKETQNLDVIYDMKSLSGDDFLRPKWVKRAIMIETRRHVSCNQITSSGQPRGKTGTSDGCRTSVVLGDSENGGH
jgi:hypothetical protein